MLALNDGRSELWQWDTGRKLTVDADCSQVHFSNKVFGRSINVDVVDGVAFIPDILLQTDKELTAWAFVGKAENGYTKISKVFKVNKRNKPADYVFTPPEQTTLEEIKSKLDYLESIQDPDAIKNAVEDYLEQNPVDAPVLSVNDKTGKVKLTADDVGAISLDRLQEATNAALEQAKASGEFDGNDYVLTPADKEEIAEMVAEMVDVPGSGGNVNYNPVEKTEDMTQPVGVDTEGKLWVAPIGGSSGGSGGNTGGTITVQSKQLFDKENATLKTMYIGGSNGVIYGSGQDAHKTIFIPVDGVNNTAVTVHREVMLNRFVVATYTSDDPQANDTGVNFASDSTKTVKKLTVPIDSSIKTVGIFFYSKSTGDSVDDIQPYIDTLMVQYGTEFTGYEDFGIITVPGGESQPVVGETSQVKRYGVRWSTTDMDDLGERCFDATGLSATIGIGATDGQSDFDNIYPWSEMKRCNIRTNAAGANIVTYEGDDGFALDGSNGDVFVKIPRFCVEKYTKDGYEYRVVSRNDGYLHPAFIENGKELDAIYVGAFEGYISDGKMHSIADVIPTNNEEPTVFLSAAQANGVCYTLYDMRCVDALWTLMAVEYGCRNSNQIIGYGYADFYQPVVNGCVSILSETGVNRVVTNGISNTTAAFMPVGSNITVCKGDQYTILTQAKLLSRITENGQTVFTFDGEPIDTDTTCFIGSAPATTNFTETSSGALAWHTGRSEFVSGSTTRNPCRYRWIENPVGNLWHNTPDITVNNLQLYLCQDMTKYGIGKVDDGYIPVFDTLPNTDRDNGSKADVTGYNYWITSLQRDDFAMGISFGKSYDKELVSTKAFGAYFYTDDGLYTNVNGGGFDHLYRCNMLTNRAYTGLNQKWYLYGARLLYKRIV